MTLTYVQSLTCEKIHREETLKLQIRTCTQLGHLTIKGHLKFLGSGHLAWIVPWAWLIYFIHSFKLGQMGLKWEYIWPGKITFLRISAKPRLKIGLSAYCLTARCDTQNLLLCFSRDFSRLQYSIRDKQIQWSRRSKGTSSVRQYEISWVKHCETGTWFIKWRNTWIRIKWILSWFWTKS